MMSLSRVRASTVAIVGVVILLLAASCSSDDSSPDDATPTNTSAAPATSAIPASTVPATTTTVFESPVARAGVQGPITGGRGSAMVVAGAADVTTLGYTETEYFLTGTATAYTSDAPLTSDGRWTVREAAAAPYTTRVVVRRPKDSTKFSGVVLVEWLNVSGGLDSGAEWSYLQAEIVRSGHAWVGVSAQRVGVEGGGLVLGENRVLKVYDPERYGGLAHPGDNFSYDMFSQAGAAVRRDAAALLGGLAPARVLAIGESQSAARLTTYVNAVAPTARVFDGYFMHSRSAVGAPLSAEPLPVVAAPEPTLFRTDLSTPVLVFSSETDVVGPRGYRKAAQPDTAVLRAWEPAGTAHADSYSLEAGMDDTGAGNIDSSYYAQQLRPPTSVRNGVITCTSGINTGPQTYVLRAALRSFDTWVRTKTPPPSMPRLELDAAGTGFTVDAAGNATGGIRTPHVDVPVATLGGTGQKGNVFCSLFGTTVPFDAAALQARYGTHDAFVAQFSVAARQAVASGAILQVDADHLIAAAQASSVAR